MIVRALGTEADDVAFGPLSVINSATGAVLLGLTAILGTIWVGVLSVKCLTILCDTSEGHDAILSWPEGSFIDWAGDVFFVVNGMAVAMLPGMLLVKLLVGSVGLSIWLVVPVETTVLFPIMLLSLLEANSPMMPLSKHVWRSLPRVWRAWGCFYIETTLLVAAVGGLIYGLSHTSQWLAVPLESAAVVAAAMIYFRLLGRVAWCYGRAVQQDEREAAEAENEE